MKICIDAGHYGKYNPSTVDKNYYESDMAWKLHNYLKTELEAYGITVITTRPTQGKDLSLSARGRASAGCDLFLSIHSNAASSESPDYAVACCQIDDETTKIDDISQAIGRKLADTVNVLMGSKGKAQVYKRMGNYNTDYYGILRAAKEVGTPAVLLEHGFHTNKANTAFLLKDANLKKLATAEAQVIASYFGVKKVAQTVPESPSVSFTPYTVKVICSALNIRKTPNWNDSDVVGVIRGGGVYTIVAETMLGSTKFGKLKSGAGWISLGSKYVKKV